MTPRQEWQLEKLGRALDFLGTHRVDDLVREVWAGKAQLWDGDGCLIATQVVDYPQQRVLHYMAVAGDLQAARQLQKTVDAWGLSEGCRIAETYARRGWEGVARPDGWTRLGGIWRKDIGNARPVE